MKCILHIGTEKTGSTAIQDWLYQNEAALSGHGIALSHVLWCNNNRALCSYFQSYLDDAMWDRGIRTEEGKADYFTGFLEEFSQEIERLRKNHAVLVISSEHFHSRLQDPKDIENLKLFLQPLFSEIKIICYLRDQYSLRHSLFSTAIKHGETTPYALFQDDVDDSVPYYNYHLMLSKWANQFGQENIHPRLFEQKNWRGHDLRKDFLSFLDPHLPDKTEFHFGRERPNKSLSQPQIRVARLINRIFPRYRKNGQYSWIRDRLIWLVCQIPGPPPKKSDTREKEIFLKRFEKSNRALFQEYFKSDKNLFLE
ncbi:hypothetical protein [Acetobacter senegalensis]|uniref:hypothetical protein n=1 Tax=Acetobacter senegalensis TaxID=446692 RepID=UPI0026511FEB|nr:hypothetical protein [Acetobacter senegalensis]MDN7352725.1 hypothetical protein [Acetobacter senegalensis]